MLCIKSSIIIRTYSYYLIIHNTKYNKNEFYTLEETLDFNDFIIVNIYQNYFFKKYLYLLIR